MSRHVDLLVLGGGPAGYSSAIRARQLGKQVVVAEKASIGGTCLNRGCIPTKSLLASANFYRNLNFAQSYGVQLVVENLDYKQVIHKKDQTVANLLAGLDFLLTRREIEVVSGEARFISTHEVQVENQAFSADKIIIATGTKSMDLPGLKTDGQFILNSDQMLAVDTLPKSLAIIGGGVIGCEFATIFAAYGVEVTIIELMDQLLPHEDREVSQALLREFKKTKIKVLTNASVAEVMQAGHKVNLKIKHKGKESALEIERVLLSVGRKPLIPKGFLGELTEKGYLKVNDTFQTSEPHIYGAGDIIGGLQLAHLAFEEGMAACDFAFGQNTKANWFVPSCVYTRPEIGSVGLTEEQVKEEYGEVIVAKYSLKGNGKAVIEGEDSGFVKIIASSVDRCVRGVRIIGPGATEIISSATLAIEQGLTLDQWSEIIYPHPTVSEAIKESVLSGLNRGLHSL